MKVMSPIRYVVVAGEASGDILGDKSDCSIKILQTQCLNFWKEFGGPLMEAQELQTVVPMDRFIRNGAG